MIDDLAQRAKPSRRGLFLQATIIAVIAGAALLARDMAKLLKPEIRGRISVVLEPNNPSPLLLEHMLGSNAWLGIGSSTATEAAFHAFREALPA